MPECIQFLFSRKCPVPIMEKGTGQTLVNLVFDCLSYNILYSLGTNLYDDDGSRGKGGVDGCLTVNRCGGSKEST